MNAPDAPDIDDLELGDLRQALSNPFGRGTRQVLDFMLTSAWMAGLRLNFLGWVLRGLFLATAVVAMLTAPRASLLLVIPVAFGGWGLAGLELFRTDIIDAHKDNRGPVGRVAAHLASSRAQAMPSVSGVLEAVTAPLLALPFIRPVSGLPGVAWFVELFTIPATHWWRSVGVLALVCYAAVALAQALTDSGYYNHELGREPTRLEWVFRWGAVYFYIAVSLGVAAAAGVRSGWLTGVVVTLFLTLALLPVISNQLQAAASHAHVAMAAKSDQEVAAVLSEDMHRVSGMLLAQADLANIRGDTQTERVLKRAYAELDAVRTQAVAGSAGQPATLGTLVEQLSHKRAHPASMNVETPNIVLAHGGGSIIRHLILDLTANAHQAGATEVLVNVRAVPAGKRTATVTITVTDNGPGFPPEIDMNSFPRGSSRRALATLCNRGRLTYERTESQTIARAVLPADLWGPPRTGRTTSTHV